MISKKYLRSLSEETIIDRLTKKSIESYGKVEGAVTSYHPYPQTIGGWNSMLAWLRENGFDIIEKNYGRSRN